MFRLNQKSERLKYIVIELTSPSIIVFKFSARKPSFSKTRRMSNHISSGWISHYEYQKMHYAYIDEEPVIINRPGDGGGGFEGITCFSGGGGMISISRRQQRELYKIYCQ